MPRRASVSKKRLIRADDLKRFVLVTQPQVSPSGDRILFVRKHCGAKSKMVSNLWLADVNTGEAKQFTSGERDGAPLWSPDGTRIAFISGRSESKPQIFVIPSSGGEAIQLTNFPEGSIREVKWSPDGTRLAVAFRPTAEEWTEEAKKKREAEGLSIPPKVIETMWYRLDGDGYFQQQRYHLYIVDANSGEHRKLFDKDVAGFFSFDWSPDSSSLVVAANTATDALLKPWKSRLYLVNALTGAAKLVPGQEDGDRGAVLWSPDGRWIAWAGRLGRTALWGSRNQRLFITDPTTGKTVDLTGKSDYCVAAATLSDTREAAFGANFEWMPNSKAILVAIGWHGETHIARVTLRGEIKFLTSGRYEYQLGNVSKDGRRVALCRGTFHELNEVFVGILSDGTISARRLTAFNDELLGELNLAKVKAHWVRSEDGTKIHTWVMKPPGMKPNSKAPAVLEIHGGPHTQYGVPFFHEMQLLAAQGYVVFFSNPRGSKGYGEAHCAAIEGDWGNKDWMDIRAVIAFIKSRPYVDAKRMAVMGGSYGGYMTNWVIGHTNEFAAAITDRCVSNLHSMAGTSDFPLVPDHYWEGNAWDRPEKLWEQSPLKYFGNVRTPTLIIHSEGDLRCNIEQAEQVFAALQLRGIPSRFIRYPSTTSHGLSRSGPPDLRLHRLGAILEWLDKYLKKQQRAKRG